MKQWFEGNSGSDGEWSEMVQACVEEGWWVCFEKSIGVWSEGQEEARTTKEDLEDASVVMYYAMEDTEKEKPRIKLKFRVRQGTTVRNVRFFLYVFLIH